MCLKHPGFPTDVKVMAEIRRIVEAWRGLRSLRREIDAGHIRLEGNASARHALPGWLLGSALATEPRCRPGAEFDLYTRTRTSTDGLTAAARRSRAD